MKKRTVTGLGLFVLLVWAMAVFAGPMPGTIGYQGYLKNGDGTPVNNEVYITFSLYAAQSGGTPLWSELRTVIPMNGVYSLQLGNSTPIPASLFANDALYLGVKVEHDAEMTPRQQLNMVPYAFRSGVADSVAPGGVSAAAIADGTVTFAKLASSGCTSGQVLHFNGSSWECAAPVSPGGTLQGEVSACTRTMLYIPGRPFVSYLPGSVTATPAIGNFVFDRVPAGNYTLIAENGQLTQSANVTVANGVTTTVPPIQFPCSFTVPVNFIVDDSVNQVYQQGDLQWKGNFKIADDYATSRKVVLDPAWGGPYPVLYDDGPIAQGGHEPVGSTANDHIWGVTVLVTTPASGSDIYEYGLIDVSPPYLQYGYGAWLWGGVNGTFSIASNQNPAQPINPQGWTFPAFGTTDLQITLDTANLDNTSLEWDTSSVKVKSSHISWNEVTLQDDGAGRFTFTLSDFVGSGHLYSHNGLAASGDQVQFVFVLGGIEYKDETGSVILQGVTAGTKATGGESFTPATVEVNPLNHYGAINVP